MAQNRVMDKTTLYLTPELRRRLRDAARRTGRRQADMIRSAIDAYLGEGNDTRPQSIGAGEDGDLGASETESWLRERWRDR
jgi:predicted transcriptional regulator